VCPVCRKSLRFEGAIADERLTNGVLQCTSRHVYQVKDEIPVLKDSKTSEKEFAWTIEFPDLKKYDRVRRKYAYYLSEDLKKADEDLKDEIVKTASDHDFVLDMATGMGTLLLKLSRQTGKNVDLMGIDVAERPLRGAKLKLKEQETYNQVSLCVMDGKHLAIKQDEVPCVTSFSGFDNIPEAKVAFREAHRILVPNGRLVFATMGLEKGSKSMVEAEKLGVGSIATDNRLTQALEEAGSEIDKLEKRYAGERLRNPMDLLPFEGDWFSNLLVQAHKK
jgi:ubiquinone/menaquinone biosynthesis C-methylase UbiE/uncharacterized protein YbaR (Trm112 family)